jgi:hypothetical protein
VSQARLTVARHDRQTLLRGLVASIDEWADETRMETQIDEASAGSQTTRNLSNDCTEVLYVGMEVRPDGDLERLVPHGEMAGVGLDDESHPSTSEPELIMGDVDADGPIPGSRDRFVVESRAAGHVETYLASPGAKGLT